MNKLNVLLIEQDPNISLLENELKEIGFIYLKTQYDSTFLRLVTDARVFPECLVADRCPAKTPA